MTADTALTVPSAPLSMAHNSEQFTTLAVIIPVLNEVLGLDALLARLRPALDNLGVLWSIIFVDDGSTDGTLAKLRQLHDSDQRVGAIALSRNFGKEIAVAAGLKYARADAVVIMDSDLQHPPETIATFVAKWREGHDVVYGERIDRSADSAWRRYGARVFYRVFHVLSGTELQQNSCDFRLLSRRAVDAINRIGERVRYNNGLFAWIGYPAVGVPFEMPPRPSGEASRWLPLKLARLAFDGLASFSTVPLRLSSVTGVFVSVVAFIYMIWIITKTLLFGDPVAGYPTLLVAVLFFAGVQLIFLGVIGEYLGRVYEEVKARPLFLVREELGVTADVTPAVSTAAQ
ncbi:MAG TPA: glycosyltransferase family 2 protein [Hyphomicrobium sp.]|nr:glycosyltransferase family 2 protein [Hyphomicrobium sp.]